MLTEKGLLAQQKGILVWDLISYSNPAFYFTKYHFQFNEKNLAMIKKWQQENPCPDQDIMTRYCFFSRLKEYFNLYQYFARKNNILYGTFSIEKCLAYCFLEAGGKDESHSLLKSKFPHDLDLKKDIDKSTNVMFLSIVPGIHVACVVYSNLEKRIEIYRLGSLFPGFGKKLLELLLPTFQKDVYLRAADNDVETHKLIDFYIKLGFFFIRPTLEIIEDPNKGLEKRVLLSYHDIISHQYEEDDGSIMPGIILDPLMKKNPGPVERAKKSNLFL